MLKDLSVRSGRTIMCYVLRMLVSVISIYCIAGCATTVDLSKLKVGPIGSTDFRKSVGIKEMAATFEFDSKSGELKILEVEPAFIGTYGNDPTDEGLENYNRYNSSGVVKGCIEFRNEYTTGCRKSMFVFNVKKGDNRPRLEIYDGNYRERVDLIAEKVNELLLFEFQSKCKVTDTKIGAFYSGKCVDGYADGYGKAFGINSYVGDFSKGKKHGKGVYIDPGNYREDGVANMTYTGDFINDHMTGQGSLTWFDKETGDTKYVGGFVDGVRTGEGELFYEDSIKPVVLKGYFLNNKLLTKEELHAYKMQSDIEYAKQFNLEQYRQAFSSAHSSSDLQKFISQYQSNDADGLIVQAKTKLAEALRREAANSRKRGLQEYRDSYASARNSYDYNQFILTYSKNDPEKLVAKAKSAKAAALVSEKENYDSVSRMNLSPNYKVKVTFRTSPGKAVTQIQKVISAMKVRDPWGMMNPYWVPTFHASAAYDDKGVVIGEWYTGYYDGWSTWQGYLRQEMDKADILDWEVVPLGETERSRSNYASSPGGNSGSATSSVTQSSGKVFICEFFCDTDESVVSKSRASFGRIEVEINAKDRDEAVSLMYSGGHGDKACKKMGAPKIYALPHCREKF